MPRPKNTVPSREVRAFIPETLAAELDLRLFSPLRGRVPYQARSTFIEQAIREKLARLSPTKESSHVLN